MHPHDFDAVVRSTIATLPPQFQKVLKGDVLIAVEPHPAPRGGRISRSLLGLYEGIPITAWGRSYDGKQPDKITLYQENIELSARSPEELPAIIRETLLHEIAHYFGFEHDRIGEMEKKWKKKRGTGT